MSRLPAWPRQLLAGWDAADRFATAERECLKKAGAAAMVEFGPVVAAEAVNRQKVELDAADRKGLALHDCAAAKEQSDRHVMRGHGIHDGPAEPAVALDPYQAAVATTGAVCLGGLSAGRAA